MSPRRANPPDDLRIALAHALGYDDYPGNLTAEPYLNYIANRHIGRGTLEEYLRLFIRVIEHFAQVQIKANDPLKTDSIRMLLDGLVLSDGEELFADTKAGSTMRRDDVEDTVLYIMGAWAMMLSSFVQLPNGFRKVITAYNIRAREKEKKSEFYDENLTSLVRGSCLLPAPSNGQVSHGMEPGDEIVRTAMKLVALLSDDNATVANSTLRLEATANVSECAKTPLKTSKSQISSHSLDAMDSLESLSIKATRLNAFTLRVFGAVRIAWTHNISRHMLLSRHGGRHILEIFALPCALNAATLTSNAVGISFELAQEIQESYCILFNAWPEIPLHAKLGRFLGIRKMCWCWSCSAHRYRTSVITKYRKSVGAKSHKLKRCGNAAKRSEFDPLVVELMNNTESSDWTQDLFPCLWSRITALEEHLQGAKPWSIWILFRDRRDTLQFWTFL